MPLNLSNFSSVSGYLWIGNHRLDTSVWTKLVDFIFDRIVAPSSCLISFFTDVMGLVMCLI
jgi:hypothetical protein